MKLVIVESPAKAKTIEGYLGKDYKVLASYGHLRDLPKSKMGINETTFDPEYIIPMKSRKTVTALKKEAAIAELVILATDEDREGEAISWHILSAANIPDDKYQRITFNEITKEAITEAVANPREINQDLVDAQQGRRVLDRIVGYNLSPLLWKKIRRGLSAGRVQSVAVRLIVEREREIQAFNPEEYWEIIANLDKNGKFEAKLTKQNDKPLEIKNEKDANKALAGIKDNDFIVDKVEQKEMKKSPSAPFTTSTLQQEASRKLRFSAKKTMMLAQRLYEGINVPGEGSVGLITYMRTDSTNLSQQALTQARKQIEITFGKEYLSPSVRTWKKKKGAQEAHEAIRPTGFNRLPESLKESLEPDQLKLYELIWRRAIASQMTEEILDLMGVDIKAGDYTFRANGKAVKFDGYSKAYNIGAGDKDVILPMLTVGDKCTVDGINPTQKFTKPPARYSEATLVKKLEEKGIGRPSTYAPTISTIKDRGYVRVEERFLHPEDIAFVVTDGLVKFFPDVVDVDFTAKMEDDLDNVAMGKIEWKKPIKEFYRPFMTEIKKAEEEWAYDKPKDVVTDEVCDKCGSAMVIKIGRFGKFMACSNFPECKNTKTIIESLGPCPKCKDGDIIARRTKRGRTFFGCSKYPDCDWATWKLEDLKKDGDDSES
jgi:DNA topoisomerase-1